MKRILHVTAGVRYWEDTKIDGVADIGIDELAKDETAKPRMPFAVERKFSKSNEYDWDIKIDVDEGVIIGWSDFNVSASTHYKVCDECEIRYYVDDRLMCHYEGYVPKFLALSDGSWYDGDYVVLDIDKNGKISHWDSAIGEDWVENVCDRENLKY